MPRIRLSKQAVIIIAEFILLSLLVFSLGPGTVETSAGPVSAESGAPGGSAGRIEFTVPADFLEYAFRLDMNSCQNAVHLDWTELLACLGADSGGDFSRCSLSNLDRLAERLRGGETIAEISKDLKYYGYYHEVYSAVLGGMVGYFRQETDLENAPVFWDPQESVTDSGSENTVPKTGGNLDPESTVPETSGNSAPENKAPETAADLGPENTVAETSDGAAGKDSEKIWVTKYGLKAYSPIAADFPFSDYDDFGDARSCDSGRRHLGHDIMGQAGTPIVAVESGTVEDMGWDRYGGWRIGIRSFDKKRYYYYAHLRRNHPYQSGLEPGSTVTAGDVIGYLGRTGYSTEENTDNAGTPHLHFGLRLTPEGLQKEGGKETGGEKEQEDEIWIDCCSLVRFLGINRSKVAKVEGTKEWTRVYGQTEL